MLRALDSHRHESPSLTPADDGKTGTKAQPRRGLGRAFLHPVKQAYDRARVRRLRGFERVGCRSSLSSQSRNRRSIEPAAAFFGQIMK
jgi:hypothetical protein